MTAHPLAWGAWTLVALSVTLTQRNPYQQVLLLAILVNVLLLYRRRTAGGYWRGALILALLPVLFNVALSRFGTHVFFRVPGIPLLGGPWTLEALVYGVSTGAALLLTALTFGILHASVRSADLLGILPRPLYRLGSVIALALTFVPQTVASIAAILEARRLRGYRTGWRAVPAILVPVLLNALERSLQYAESLDARGFGSRRRSRYRRVPWSAGDTAITLAGVAALAGLWLAPTPAYAPYVRLLPEMPSPLALATLFPLSLPAWIAASSPRHAADHV